jgi:phosphatidylglycerol---prolipoprotein diacylglyceryl transferase
MLPLLYRFRFDTEGSRVLLFIIAIGLIVYTAWSGARNAGGVDENGKELPAIGAQRRDRALMYGVIGIALAAVGIFYASDVVVPFLGKGKNEGVPLHTYGILLGAGFLSAVTVASYLARREWPGEIGIKRRDQIMDLAFSVFIGGILGSRELFVLVNWSKEYANKPAERLATALELIVAVVLTLLLVFRHRFSKPFAENLVQKAGLWFVYVLVGGRVAFSFLFGEGTTTLFGMLGGGLVFQGGLIGATLASVLYCLQNDIEFLRLADLAAPTVSLGAAFGRLGCFSAGCCWGKAAGPNAPFSVHFPGSHSTKTIIGSISDTPSLAWSSMSTDTRYVLEKTGEVFSQMVPDAVQISTWVREHDHTLAIHPVQLYDSFAQVAFFALMLWLRQWRRFHGQIFGIWLMGYSVIRSSVELLRGDSERGTLQGKLLEWGYDGVAALFPAQAWYNISTGQFVSILLLSLGGFIVFAGFRAHAAQPKADLAALTAG